jgi:nucleotidyltransferase/DNA polymerase involved in DNA repair
MADLPPRLSEQQQFLLATALGDGSTTHERMRRLSWAAAEEFDDVDAERIIDPERERKTAEEWADEAFDRFDDSADAGEYASLGSALQAAFLPEEKQLRSVHSASVSRSVRRLEDRDLVERQSLRLERLDGELQLLEVYADDTRTTHVMLTDAGERAAEEVQRRVDDGRRKLSFATTPWRD